MGYESNITSKGQVTIPKRIRELLGLEPGQRVMFEMDGEGRVRILSAKAADEARRAEFSERMKQAETAFAENWAYPQLSTDEFMDLVREPLQTFERDPDE
jgi:AbrB family looped-hinge helix DNA binding protein